MLLGISAKFPFINLQRCRSNFQLIAVLVGAYYHFMFVVQFTKSFQSQLTDESTNLSIGR